MGLVRQYPGPASPRLVEQMSLTSPPEQQSLSTSHTCAAPEQDWHVPVVPHVRPEQHWLSRAHTEPLARQAWGLAWHVPVVSVPFVTQTESGQHCGKPLTLHDSADLAQHKSS